jgi:hypothetical protein
MGYEGGGKGGVGSGGSGALREVRVQPRRGEGAKRWGWSGWLKGTEEGGKKEGLLVVGLAVSMQ